MNEEKRFAVLIDAENVSSKYVKRILDEISNYGIVTYKRIYGDWTGPARSAGRRSCWKTRFPRCSSTATPGTQRYRRRHDHRRHGYFIFRACGGLCLVSSDSDFTKLAVRLRESGMMVVGMGEIKTPKPFSVACDVFKYLDILTGEEQIEEEEPAGDTDASEENMTDVETIREAMVSIVEENGDEENGLGIGELGSRILKRYPDFDVRNYGYTKLSKFLTTFDCFSLTRVNSSVSVKMKNNPLSLETVQQEIIRRLRETEQQETDLGQLHQALAKVFPQFHVKDYGYTNFSSLVREIPGMVIKSTGKNGCVKRVRYQETAISPPPTGNIRTRKKTDTQPMRGKRKPSGEKDLWIGLACRGGFLV